MSTTNENVPATRKAYHGTDRRIKSVEELPYASFPGAHAIHAVMTDGTKKMLLYYTPAGKYKDGIPIEEFEGLTEPDARDLWNKAFAKHVQAMLFL